MHTIEEKKRWGFAPLQEKAFEASKLTNKNLEPARVVFHSYDLYKVVLLGKTEQVLAKLKGNADLGESGHPAVGDWVLVDAADTNSHQHLPIHAVLPRISVLKRKKADREQVMVSNANWVVLVSSFNSDFNDNRIDRGLAMIEHSQAKPILVINKSDLVSPDVVKSLCEKLSQKHPGIPVLSISATKDLGTARLEEYFNKGDVVAFLGMSGVGKSTLLNSIAQSELTKTSQVREYDGRGKHTTTSREMFDTSKGYWVVDLPGIKTFSLTGDSDALSVGFDDIEDLVAKCKFSNCQHKTEPGCAVKNALQGNELSEARWGKYLELKAELQIKFLKKARVKKRR